MRGMHECAQLVVREQKVRWTSMRLPHCVNDAGVRGSRKRLFNVSLWSYHRRINPAFELISAQGLSREVQRFFALVL